MEKELLESYNLNKNNIKLALNKFRNLNTESQFKEFMFCLLTPQSNAQRCWRAVEEISKLNYVSENSVRDILKKRTRFHNIKAKRIIKAREMWESIKPILSNPDRKSLRNEIIKKVDGYGLKEASHFLRNIGKSDNQIAILDRHILRNLKKINIIEQEKIKSYKHYLEVEQKFIEFANKSKIPADELDMLWWSQENGEIFK